MTFGTPSRSSGSRAEVGSSKKITSGSMASAGDGHALFLSAREVARIGAGLFREADLGQQCQAARAGRLAIAPLEYRQRFRSADTKAG